MRPEILWRCLLLHMLMLWQGGFLFYSAIVVKLGSELLGNATQSLVTREVTLWLNGLGFITLLLLLMDALRAPHWRRCRGLLLVLALLQQAYLSLAHRWLSAQIDSDAMSGFYQAHRNYLIVSGTLWGSMLVHTILLLLAWRALDRTRS